MADRVTPTTDQIAKRAYQLYVNRGREDGWDLQDWLTAEQQLLVELNETPEQRLRRVATAAARSRSGHARLIRTQNRRRR